MSFKVPQFLSKAFNSKSTEERAKYIEKYKQWHSQEVTQQLLEGLKKRIQCSIEDEEKQEPKSEFEFQQQVAANRAERLLLRSLIKEIDYK